MDAEVKKLTSQETDKFIELIEIFNVVFEMKNLVIPVKKYLQEMLVKDNFMIFSATVEDKVVGGLTAYALQQYYSESALVYVYDLAVKSEYQRKGIGRLLISNLNSYCKEKGIEEVFLQADLEDDYAIDFYRSTGAKSEQVIHFYYSLTEKDFTR